MNENLEKRKAEMLNYLKDEYTEKPRKWWHARGNIYTETRLACKGNPYKEVGNEIIIRNNSKGALLISALFFIPYFWSLCKHADADINNPGFWFELLIAFFVVTAIITSAFDKRPRLILNNEGIWIYNSNMAIRWDYIVATYIIEDSSGESTSYYLQVHFYDYHADEFTKNKLNITGLEMTPGEIAFHIECWKVRTGNNVVTV